MIKTLAKSIREYKKASILTPMFVSFEVIIECLIPWIASIFIAEIESDTSRIKVVIGLGALLVFLAVLADTENEERRRDMHKILLVCMAVAFVYQLLLYLRKADAGNYIQYLFWY